MGRNLDYQRRGGNPLNSLIEEVGKFYRARDAESARNVRYVQSGVINQIVDPQGLTDSSQIESRIRLLDGMVAGGNLDASLKDLVTTARSTLTDVHLPAFQKTEGIVDRAQDTMTMLSQVSKSLAKGEAIPEFLQNANNIISDISKKEIEYVNALTPRQASVFKENLKEWTNASTLFDVILAADSPDTPEIDLDIPEADNINAASAGHWNAMVTNTILGNYDQGMADFIKLQRGNAAGALYNAREAQNEIDAEKKRLLAQRISDEQKLNKAITQKRKDELKKKIKKTTTDRLVNNATAVGGNIAGIGSFASEASGTAVAGREAPQFGFFLSDDFKNNYLNNDIGRVTKDRYPVKDTGEYAWSHIVNEGDDLEKVMDAYLDMSADTFYQNPLWVTWASDTNKGLRNPEDKAIENKDEWLIKQLMILEYQKRSGHSIKSVGDQINKSAQTLMGDLEGFVRGIATGYFEQSEEGKQYLKANFPGIKNLSIDTLIDALYNLYPAGMPNSGIKAFAGATKGGFSVDLKDAIQKAILKETKSTKSDPQTSMGQILSDSTKVAQNINVLQQQLATMKADSTIKDTLTKLGLGKTEPPEEENESGLTYEEQLKLANQE